MRTGTIGVCADEISRYTQFWVSIAATMGRVSGWTLRIGMGRNIARNCNRLVRNFDGDMLWFQADDHVFPINALERLESHGLDCVVPLILVRQKPFNPVIFSEENEDGKFVAITEPPANELIEVHAAGTGGMLISREALEAVGPDPFEWDMLRNGEFLGEDLVFCKKLRKAGIKIHCDTGVHMGHLSATSIWPTFGDDGLAVRLDLNGEQKE